MQVNHEINALTFGDEGYHKRIKSVFGENDHTEFDMTKHINREFYKVEEDEPKDYYYFMKLVPHVF